MDENITVIKKMRNKKKKRVKKMKRATYFFIPPIKKFLNPFKVYRLNGDIILQEEQQYLGPKISLYNKYKIMTSVEHDISKAMLMVKFDDNKSVFSCAWQYLVNRMKNFGDANAKAWADAIENYCQGYNLLFEDDKKQDHVEKLFLTQKQSNGGLPNEMKESLMQGSAVLIWRFGQIDNKVYCTHMGFNENFLNMLDYDIGLMVTFLIKRGIPEFFPTQETNVSEFIKAILKYFYNKAEFDGIGERQSYLLTRTSQIKPVYVKPNIFFNKSSTGNLEYELWLSYREDNEKPTITSTSDDAYTGLEEIIKSNEKEADDFFLRFYSQHYIGSFTYSDRICKIKTVP
jgi:hypothetical protein